MRWPSSPRRIRPPPPFLVKALLGAGVPSKKKKGAISTNFSGQITRRGQAKPPARCLQRGARLLREIIKGASAQQWWRRGCNFRLRRELLTFPASGDPGTYSGWHRENKKIIPKRHHCTVYQRANTKARIAKSGLHGVTARGISSGGPLRCSGAFICC